MDGAYVTAMTTGASATKDTTALWVSSFTSSCIPEDMEMESGKETACHPRTMKATMAYDTVNAPNSVSDSDPASAEVR